MLLTVVYHISFWTLAVVQCFK